MSLSEQKTGSLSGKIIDYNGESIINISVKLKNNSNGNYSIVSIEPADNIINFAEAGYNNGGKNMQIIAGANTLNVTMILQTGTLSGKVSNQDGIALSGVTVSINDVVQATTDSSGNFAISGILPGTYAITFTKVGYISVTK
jgi:hypothetical protein